MTKVGYACTSTVEQNLDSQIIALKATNCEIIRTEQKSENNLAERIELNNILDFIHKDEYLVVTRIVVRKGGLVYLAHNKMYGTE
jgi:DNA invertase Pin-like site-specific DNA recombinase